MIQLSRARNPYIIPSYSLTGDLLSYLKCGLQYRYANRGELPPSKPVQLWFGEFIHAVMEEAYVRWNSGVSPSTFPWDWESVIRPIEQEVYLRLAGRALIPPRGLFCPGTPCQCPSGIPPGHKLLSSERAHSAIDTWGQSLFPLISDAEVPLKALRELPATARYRSEKYEVTGIADVIGSIKVSSAPQGNLLVRELYKQLPDLAYQTTYEIIVDYKGTRRPTPKDPVWNHYANQIQTYAWLRGRQPGAAPVVAGIILFLNELVPSATDIKDLQSDIKKGQTDIMPEGVDRLAILNWRGGPLPTLSTALREDRCLRLVPVSPTSVATSLEEFDRVVGEIEESVHGESAGGGLVVSWASRPSGSLFEAPDKRTCDVCDHKYYCSLAGTFRTVPSAPRR